MSNQFAVIMAGGKGERFWPLSTSSRPKQLLDLVGDRALIAQAVERIAPFIPAENVFIVTNKNLVSATRSVLPELPPENVVGEPVGRDTAAAAALGSALVESRDPHGAFCILTADQIMGDLDRFRETLQQSLDYATKSDVLITIGIRPLHPDTGFGYIQSGDALAERGGIEFFKADAFKEKPQLNVAKQYFDDGGYYWNSGMFIWSVASLRKAMAAHVPHLIELMDAVVPHVGKDSLDGVLEEQFADLPKISVDYALMEKADNIVMAAGTFYWDDVGSWPALINHFDQDAQGNTAIGTVEALEAGDNIVYSKGRLTAMLGVNELIVVQAEGVTMICAKDRAQDIKKLVAAVREREDCGELI